MQPQVFWQTTHFDPKTTSTPQIPVDKDTAKEHGNQALEGLRTLGTLVITNGQFRKLRKSTPDSPKNPQRLTADTVKDTVVLMRDMAADAATNAAGKGKCPQS